MDLFAGLDGLGPAAKKNTSLAEQMKNKSAQNLKFTDDLDLLAGLEPTSTSSTATNTFTSVKPATSSRNNISQPAAADEEDDPFGIFNSAPPMAPKTQVPASTQSREQTQQKPRSEARSEVRSEPRARGSGWSDQYELDPPTSKSQRSSESSPRTSQNASRSSTPKSGSRRPSHDREIAQLVEMGFEPEDAQRALTAMNGSVRGSVSWLMAEAQGLPLPEPKKSSGLAGGDFSDLQNQASQIGAAMFSTASKYWSRGRKEIEKAYNQYNNGSSSGSSSSSSGGGGADSGQPAWMRDKAKHDARGAALPSNGLHRPSDGLNETRSERRSTRGQFSDGDFEMPQRRREPAAAPPTPARAPPTPARVPERPSRADLFRQRQRERNGSAAASPVPESAAADEDLLGTAEPSATAAKPAAAKPAAAKPAAKPAAAEPDLLNLASPAGSGGLSSTSADIYTTSRALGSQSFRNGDYEAAVVHYTTALQVVPEQNELRPLLLSNRSAALMKAGDLRAAYDDTQEGIRLLPGRGQGAVVEGTSMADIWVKLVTRNAQAAENMEKYSAALEAWQLLLDNGHATPAVLAAKRRCVAASNPEKVAQAQAAGNGDSGSSSGSGAVKTSKRRGWGTTGATPTTAAGKEALARVKAEHDRQAAEEREKDQLRDRIGARVEEWKRGNEKNLRVLLSSLQNVLWRDAGWTPVSAADLVVPRKVRVVYMKAVARTHPDKIATSASVEVKMISQSVFVVLQTAWDTFRQENNL